MTNKLLTQSGLSSGQNPLERLLIVSLTMSIWSGQTVLRPGEMELVGGESLPSEIAELGAKKICNPDDLTPFGKIRARANRLLHTVGVAFSKGCIAIPLDQSKDILDRLDGFIDEYKIAKAEFLQNYESHLNEWINANPTYAPIIQNGALNKAEVANRFQCNVWTTKVQAIRPQDEKAQEELAESLADCLLSEVSYDCSGHLKTILGRPDVPVSSLKIIRRNREKLLGLAFLSGKILPIVKMIDTVLTQVESIVRTSGIKWLTGPVADRYRSVVAILANESLLHDFLEGKISIDPSISQSIQTNSSSSLYRAVEDKSSTDELDEKKASSYLSDDSCEISDSFQPVLFEESLPDPFVVGEPDSH